MPELPEVETIRNYLHNHILGKKIKSVEILNVNSFQGAIKDILNATIKNTSRKGKVLNLHLDNKKYIAVHLKMSGQLLYSLSRDKAVFAVKIPLSDSNRMPGRTTRVIIDFSDGSCFFLTICVNLAGLKYQIKKKVRSLLMLREKNLPWIILKVL